MTRRGWLLTGAAVVIGLPVLGLAAAAAFFDGEQLRPRLVAAVEGATGRQAGIGRVGLALSLSPTLTLSDVALANAPWGSRPQMVTARRAEVQVALLPLLSRRVEVERVTLLGPDILLETGPDGRGNWVFDRPAQPQAQPAPDQPAPGQAPREARGMEVGIERLRVEDATLTWRGAQPIQVSVPALDASIPADGPARAEGRVALRGETISFRAETGPIPALGGAGPWPVQATLSGAGAEARVDGRLQGTAWEGRVEARVAELARLQPLLPDIPMLPLRDVALRATAAGQGAELGSLSEAQLTLGAADLPVLAPGLRLSRGEVTAPALDQPIRLSAEASLDGAPLSLAGQGGSAAQLLGRQGGPFPLDLQARAAGAEAAVQGTVRDIRAVAGVDLGVRAAVPDLAALSPLAGTPLPAIRDLRLSTRLAERTPGFGGGAHLRQFALESSAGDARGDLTLVIGERPGVMGALESQRLDADALMAARPAPAAQPAPAATGANSAPAVPARPAIARREDATRVIPALPIPFAALRMADADLRWSIGELALGGQPYREVAMKLGIYEGKAQLDPLSFTSPAGPVQVQARADATADPPSLHVALRSPGLDLATLQRAAGQPVRIAGRAELDADLAGRGADLRAQAASLGGHLGLAMLGGSAEPALMAQAQAALANVLPVQLPRQLPIECVAVRADARDGVVQLPVLLLDAPAAKVAGGGTVDLREERLNIPVQHDVRLAGQAVRVAAVLGGTLANPGYGGVRVVGGLAAIGNQLGGDLGNILGALGGGRGGGGGSLAPLPGCGPSLAAARGGREGPVPAAPQPAAAPAPQAAPPAQAAPAQPGLPRGAEDLLRGLLRR